MNSYCILGIVLTFGMIFTMFNVDKNNLKQKFYQSLNSTQKYKYENIINERRNIFFKGYLIGLLISLSVVTYLPKNFDRICFSAGFTTLFNYLFYILHPKSFYIITELDHPLKRQLWLNIYRMMQFKYHFGLVLGIVASILISLR
jgi:hypothetical protein